MRFYSLMVSVGIMFSTMTFGSDRKILQQTENALKLRVTDAGFDYLSEVATDMFLKDLETFTIEGFEKKIPLVVKLEAHEIKIKPEIESLRVFPAKNGIKIDLQLKNIDVSIGSVTVANPILPLIGKTCYQTRVSIGQSEVVPILSNIKLGVDNGIIEASVKRFSFELADHQYEADGPSRCEGPFGIDLPLTRWIIASILDHSRPIVEKVVHSQINKIADLVARMLNEQTHRAIPFTLPDILVLPSQDIEVHVRPRELLIDQRNFDISLDAALLPGSREIGQKVAEEPPFDLELLARIGIKPEFINQTLNTLLRKGTLPFEVKPELHEMVAMILRTEEMADFWPDLNLVETDTNQMRLFVTVDQPPVMTPFVETGALGVGVPQVGLRFMISSEGEWIDYFTVNLQVKTGVIPNLSAGRLELKLLDSDLKISGNWAESYEPIDPTFNHEDMGFVLRGLLEVVTEGDAVAFDLPVLPIGTTPVTFDNLLIERNFIIFDMVTLKDY